MKLLIAFCRRDQAALEACDAASNFKGRLLTVIKEFGAKGFPVSSLRKKYAQIKWDPSALIVAVCFFSRYRYHLWQLVTAASLLSIVPLVLLMSPCTPKCRKRRWPKD
eukprot:6162423-Amphidinium_carterae.1